MLKKGSRGNCYNYREIAVASTVSRIYGRLLKNNTELEYENMETEKQTGFRAGRFPVSQILQKKTVNNQEVHMLFIDLQKTYDSVPLQNFMDPKKEKK